MLRHFLSLGKASFTYLIVFSLPSFVGLVLLPLYTRFLTPVDYGITAVCASVTGLLGAFYQLGLLSAYGRQFFDHRNDPLQLKRFVSTVTVFLAVYGLLVSLIVVSFGRPVSEALLPEVPFSPHFQVAIWASYCNLASMLLLTLFRCEMRATAYLVFSATHIFLTTFLTTILVVYLRQGALGYLTAGLASNAVLGIAALWLLRRYLALCFDWAKLRSSLRYGLPLVPGAIGAWMFSVADRVMLSSLVSTTEAGLYSLGFQVANAVALVSAAMNFAWRPFFFSELSDKGDAARGELAKFATYWVLAMCIVYLLVSGFGRELLELLTPAPYHESHKVVPLLALGLLFGGLCYIFVDSLLWQGKTARVAIITITSGIANIILNLLLLPRMQMLGAALATALANLLLLLLTGSVAMKAFSLPYEHGRMAKIVGVSAACQLLLVLATRLGGFWVQLAAKLLVLGAFPVFLCLVGFPKREEVETVRALALRATSRSWRRR